MSDKTDFQDLASELIGEFSGVPVEIEYKQFSSRYTPGGNVIKVSTTYPTRCVPTKITSEEIRSGIAVVSDLKILIAALELEVTPLPKDKFVYKTKGYTVINVNVDPANALWTIIARS